MPLLNGLIRCLLLLGPALAFADQLHNQPPFHQQANQLQLLAPIQRLAYSNDWRSRAQRTLRRGSHTFIILSLRSQPCSRIRSNQSGVKFFSFYPTRLTTPSYEGGQTGWFYDVLVPRNNQSCALSPFVLAEWIPRQSGPSWFETDAGRVEVEIRFEGHFIAPRRHFHIGLTNSFLIKGHCTSYCPLEAQLGQAYRRILQQHHLRPYHHWVRTPPIRNGRLDLDAGAEQGSSFRQQVMHDSSDYIAFPRATGHPEPLAYLRALQQTIAQERLAGKAWVYVRDEPQNLSVLKAELSLYRTYAPSVMTMVTTRWHPSLAQQVDIFAPLIHQLDSHRANSGSEAYDRKRLWPYTSCMGSCGPNRRSSPTAPRVPGPNTGLPDLLIDRPVESMVDYFRRLEQLRADATLYYHAVEGYPLYRQGLLLRDDPWNFGGNGDGLLLYPGRPGELGLQTHQPLPSFRLKLLRHLIEQRGF